LEKAYDREFAHFLSNNVWEDWVLACSSGVVVVEGSVGVDGNDSVNTGIIGLREIWC
jgi:hypothetical protein